MIRPAQAHLTTEAEIRLLLEMGYQINMDIPQVVHFINTNFPNLDLALLAMTTEISLARLNTQPELIRSIEITNTGKPEISFSVSNPDFDHPMTGLGISRTFHLSASELHVEHILLVIPKAQRSQGLARIIFRTWLQQYINAGVRKIKVSTGLSDGGYVWAKNFFTADKRSEMDTILKKAQTNLTDRQFKAVQTIYNLYYDQFPDGNAFPIIEWAQLPFMKAILRGTYWDGTMDFNNSEQISNFITYIFK